MKITAITFESKRSDGNWGNDVVRLEASPAAHEDPLNVLDAMKTLVDAQFNHARRKAENDKQLAILNAEDGVTEEQRGMAARYIDKYEGWLEKVHAAQDMLEYER